MSIKDEDFRCNIVVIGKTGVGKSCLLNYLFGTNFKTGVGKPVTGQGFYEEDGEANGIKVRLFDSWGIEANKVKEWDKLLHEQAEKHGAHKDPKDWFHAVVYCISAGGARVEEIDVDIISNFINQGYKVVVALTRADTLHKKGELQLLKNVVYDNVSKEITEKKNNLAVVPVISWEGKKRTGEVVRKEGREELIKEILSAWKETVMNRFPIAIVERLCAQLDEYGNDLQLSIDNEEDVDGRFEKNEELANNLMDKIYEKFDYLCTKGLKKEADELVKDCFNIGKNLVLSFGKDDFVNVELPFCNYIYENECKSDEIVGINVITLGIAGLCRALFSRYSSKKIDKAKNRLKGLVVDCIEALKNDVLQKKVIPQLREQIKNLGTEK